MQRSQLKNYAPGLNPVTGPIARPGLVPLMLAMLVLSALLPVRSLALDVGDPAPDFELPGSDGNTYHLADYRDKQAVVLAWFPRAFTSGLHH